MFSISVTYFAAAAAILAVVMWMDYYRRIDVFEPESYKAMLLALGIGALSPLLSLQIYGLAFAAGIHETGDLAQDLLYAVFVVGLNEEMCKLLAVLVTFRLLKKQLNDAVDYLIFAGICALGFALVENFVYFENHGLSILSSRAFYSVLEHLINTSLIVYGIYRKKLFNKGSDFKNAAVAISLAVASHGLFDYFLGLPNFEKLNAIISMLIYLVGINFLVQMLNNANNYSVYFNYQKVQASSKLVKRLLLWFFATLLFSFFFNALFEPMVALLKLAQSLVSDGLIYFLVIVRVSRFSIIKGNYTRLSLKLPFYFVQKEFADFGFPFSSYGLKIRGESFREQALNSRVGQKLSLFEHGNHSVELQGLVEKKLKLRDDQVAYLFSTVGDGSAKKKRFLLSVRLRPLEINSDEGIEVAAYQVADTTNLEANLKLSLSTLRLSGYYHCMS